ncbi:hypothetical protein HF908_22330 (plasmid) [Ralstonia pseudosolanacearum]|uniref:hypothetical protein n=1 Tax=Ralstonia pseudosolanacearum TaxID=1310165 RepID=UPI001866C1A7|nr:hypothetical protein [Ralstonia pseudosolanacearum]QOK94164.1 hypothetical protein HF908_22330 [Ralstonia pseudosolanacearum]
MFELPQRAAGPVGGILPLTTLSMVFVNPCALFESTLFGGWNLDSFKSEYQAMGFCFWVVNTLMKTISSIFLCPEENDCGHFQSSINPLFARVCWFVMVAGIRLGKCLQSGFR